MRHDDAHGTVVERAGRLIDGVGADADDGGHAGRQRGDAELRHFLDAERAVLAVDEHPVVAGGGGQHRGGNGAQVVDAEAQGHASGLQALAGGADGQWHGSFPLDACEEGEHGGGGGVNLSARRPSCSTR